MLPNFFDDDESIVMSLGSEKAASRGKKLGMSRVEVYQLRTVARGQKPKNPVEMPKAPAVTAGSSPESKKTKSKPKEYSGIKDESSLDASDYQRLNKGEPVLVFTKIPKTGGYAVNMLLPPSDSGANKIFTGVTARTRERAASIYLAEQKERSVPKSQRPDSPKPKKSESAEAKKASRQVKDVLSVAAKKRQERADQEKNGQQSLLPSSKQSMATRAKTTKPKEATPKKEPKSRWKPGDRILY